ncbi:MAG: DUF3999 family protein [Bacteroidetes bacterium]|jgi:hypothetical protein|nr:DUF3999 family protein [Bacteroidota bacterium]
MLARIVLLTSLLLLFLGQALAATLEKNDFAYGFNITVDGDDAVYSLPLPADVYASSVAPRLEDVRVFNGAGEIVPHEFRYAAPVMRPVLRTVELPYYPLSSERGAADEDISLEIQRSINGEIVGIERKGNSIQLPALSYLLDMAKAGSAPLTLQLEWQSNDTGFMLPVELEESADLIEWKQLKKATLADLEFMDMKLRHREIVLHEYPERYVRLIFGPGGKAVQLNGVKAVSGEEPELAKRSWLRLPLQEVAGEEHGILQAELGGLIPVDRLQLQFPQANTLLHARISTKTAKTPWQDRTEALFYELLENTIVLQNDPVSLSRENVTHIRLEPLENSAAAPNNSFKLQVGFIPHDLVFIARGGGPYVLAYGNGAMKTAGSEGNNPDVHGLAGEKKRSIVANAGLGAKIILGGETRLAATASAPWQNMALWLVLILGAAILVVLTWSVLGRRGKV